MQSFCLGLSCRSWPTFVDCDPNDSLILKVFVALFSSAYLVSLGSCQSPLKLPKMWEGFLHTEPVGVSQERRGVSGLWDQRGFPGWGPVVKALFLPVGDGEHFLDQEPVARSPTMVPTGHSMFLVEEGSPRPGKQWDLWPGLFWSDPSRCCWAPSLSLRGESQAQRKRECFSWTFIGSGAPHW